MQPNELAAPACLKSDWEWNIIPISIEFIIYSTELAQFRVHRACDYNKWVKRFMDDNFLLGYFIA